MRIPDDYSGFFTSEDLAEMQVQLESNAPPNETPVERENRALAIILRRQARSATAAQKKSRKLGTDRPSAS